MRLSLKLPTPAGRLDLVSGALLLSGAALIVVSLAAAPTLLAPTAPIGPVETPPGAALPEATAASRPVGLLADQVATVLVVDASLGAGTAVHSGNRVDVLGYFSRQVIGSESVTRLLLRDAPVLTVDRAGPTVALTLAVSSAAAVLLQEAQAIGGRPFVALRAGTPMTAPLDVPRAFSDTDLAARLAGIR